ncbi:unnamed protein product, partial [Soboliphyme baturini]|uniref:UBX domain-containing protein n=1 Tax=Soboliphyme baturini TaxID=241478 RepID=A0A183I8U9_9BILA
PTTNVTVRLVDGSRLVLHLNHSHTISDIRSFVCESRPEYALQPFYFMTSYPSREIEDEHATLAEANLLNSLIVQRLKK